MDKPRTNFLGNSPFTRVILGSVGLGVVYIILVLLSGDLKAQVPSLLLDLVFCIGGLVLWLFFFAQFVLPVRKVKDRQMAAQRLYDYLTGSHGPALFIEGGAIRERGSERRRSGPGVIWLDTASAALLQRATHYTRPVGPGIVFTDGGEFIGGTVDLHIQSSRLGPLEMDDVFGEGRRLKKDTDQVLKERMLRRFETQATTRDSHEVVPNISVSFRLDAEEGEGGTEFGYRPESVQKAITGRPLDASSPDPNTDLATNWLMLPAHLAADIWRETLTKYTLMELFEQDPTDPQGVLQFIIQHVRDRLQKPVVVSLDEYGKPRQKKDRSGNLLFTQDGKPILEEVPSREYEILQSRGIRILGVGINNLRFRKDVEDSLLEHWKTTWLKRAEQERAVIEKRRTFAQESGRQEAPYQFALAISKDLGNHSPDDTLTAREILKTLIQGNIQLCENSPVLIQLSRGNMSQLEEILGWLEKVE